MATDVGGAFAAHRGAVDIAVTGRDARLRVSDAAALPERHQVGVARFRPVCVVGVKETEGCLVGALTGLRRPGQLVIAPCPQPPFLDTSPLTPSLHKELRAKMQTPARDETETRVILHTILDHLGRDRIKQSYGEYRQGNHQMTIEDQLVGFLTGSCRRSISWAEDLDDFEGLHYIPMMTTHKSEGLEYEVVIFVGSLLASQAAGSVYVL